MNAKGERSFPGSARPETEPQSTFVVQICSVDTQTFVSVRRMDRMHAQFGGVMLYPNVFGMKASRLRSCEGTPVQGHHRNQQSSNPRSSNDMVPAKASLGPDAMAFLVLCAALLPAAAGLEVLSLQQTHQPEKALWADWTNWDTKTLRIPAFRISFQADSPPVLAARSPRPQELLPVNDVLYTVEADVAGTRARLVVDTGSSDIWAKESVLTSSLDSGRAKVRSFELQGEPRVPYLLLKFGVGSVFGVPITVKDFCVAGICVKDQDLVMGLQIKDVLELDTFDGLLGLAFPRDSQDPFGITFLRRLQMTQNKTLSFALLLDSKKPFIAIGECKELLEGHKHHMLPVHPLDIGLTMWTVSMDLNITDLENGKTLLSATGFGALDSGSTLLVLPAPLFLALTTHLFRAPVKCFMGDTILCMCDTDLNDLSFTFGEFTVNFTKEELLLPVAEEVCRINIMPMPPAVRNLPVLILGQTFLRKVYAVFDPWKPAVWLADRGSAKVQQMQKAATGSDFIAPMPAVASDGLMADAPRAAAELAASMRKAATGSDSITPDESDDVMVTEETMRKVQAIFDAAAAAAEPDLVAGKGTSWSFDATFAAAAWKMGTTWPFEMC
eukprot:s286_g28.t1